MPDSDDEWFRAGCLAAALAKAQASFPPVPRDKEVTVKTKTGGTYKFKYAPLDSILNAVRQPLAANGLAISQLLDGHELVTMLLHKDGGSLVGRATVPNTEGAQAYGSAITYLRRYSLQAVLGIAAEEDDDGNQADGNTATFGKPAEDDPTKGISAGYKAPPKPIDNGDGSLIGTGELAKDFPDFLPKQSPDGMVLAFKLTSDSGGIKVIARGALAEVLPTIKEEIIGKRVSCWGHVRDETFRPKNAKRDVTYQVLDLERIKTKSGTLPMVEAPTQPLFEGPMFEGMGDDDPPS